MFQQSVEGVVGARVLPVGVPGGWCGRGFADAAQVVLQLKGAVISHVLLY